MLVPPGGGSGAAPGAGESTLRPLPPAAGSRRDPCFPERPRWTAAPPLQAAGCHSGGRPGRHRAPSQRCEGPTRPSRHRLPGTATWQGPLRASQASAKVLGCLLQHTCVLPLRPGPSRSEAPRIAGWRVFCTRRRTGWRRRHAAATVDRRSGRPATPQLLHLRLQPLCAMVPLQHKPPASQPAPALAGLVQCSPTSRCKPDGKAHLPCAVGLRRRGQQSRSLHTHWVWHADWRQVADILPVWYPPLWHEQDGGGGPPGGVGPGG